MQHIENKEEQACYKNASPPETVNPATSGGLAPGTGEIGVETANLGPSNDDLEPQGGRKRQLTAPRKPPKPLAPLQKPSSASWRTEKQNRKANLQSVVPARPTAI